MAHPKFSATVCPISASVFRTPRFTPAPPPGEYARIGTYSREWSVVGQRGSGSQPWSAVISNIDRKSTRSELQSRLHLVCRLLLEKKKNKYYEEIIDVRNYID